MNAKASLRWTHVFAVFVLIGLTGFLRFHSWYEPPPVGDEKVHAAYVDWVLKNGFGNYPELLTQYGVIQDGSIEPILPPTRFCFVALGVGVCKIRGGDSIGALRVVSKLASLGIVALGIALGFLLGGRQAALLSGLFLAVSPLQLHCARIGFVDVLFGLTVLTALVGLVLLYTSAERFGCAVLLVSLPAIVLTKESAVFVLPALVGAVMLGQPTPNRRADRLFLIAIVGGALGTSLLMLVLFGGVDRFVDAVLATAVRLPNSEYSMTYQSGPWFRYLVDYMLVSPILFVAFVWAFGYLSDSKDAPRMLMVFLIASYVPMVLIKGGTNLRFALTWEPALVVLLATALVRRLGSTRWATSGALWIGVVIAAMALGHFFSFFPSARPYDLVTLSLLRIVGIYRGDYTYDH